MRSKHILIIISHLAVGGTEMQTLNLVRGLIKKGYLVDVVCLFRHIATVVKQYQEAGATIFIVSPAYNDYGITIRYPRRWSLIKFLYTNLKNVLKNRNYDAIHVQYMSPALSVVLVLYYLLHQRQILVTAHTMADIYKTVRPIHFIQKHCLRAFTCITLSAEKSFFNSAQLYDPSLPLHKRNHFTIYNALPAYVQIRSTPRLFSETITIGVVSRLEPIKGMDLVIPAFARIEKQHPSTRLLIVGDGSLRGMMEKQALDLTKKGNILFTGKQSPDTLQEMYDQIDILLVPSHSEGFGLTAIEGMARGCVVIAARTGGLTEVIKENETGLLHEPGSIDSLAAYVKKILKDRVTMMKLSERAIEDVRRFSSENFDTLFNNLYSRIIH